MLSYSDLKKGVKIILDAEPYEVLETRPLKKAQRRVTIQTKIKNLITGNVFGRNFHQGDTFEEAEISKIKAKFLYQHKEKFFFCEIENPANRFNLTKEQIGKLENFLKPNQIVEKLVFQEKVINISLPIKLNLKVTEAPPGIKGNRAESGTKIITLETKAQINVPLFIKEGDIIEVNTETGEYVRRVK